MKPFNNMTHLEKQIWALEKIEKDKQVDFSKNTNEEKQFLQDAKTMSSFGVIILRAK